MEIEAVVEAELAGARASDGGQRAACKRAYLHVRRHLYCLVTTRVATPVTTPVTTPVLPCQDACSDTYILIFWAGRPGAP
jgi:hypothetical protein